MLAKKAVCQAAGDGVRIRSSMSVGILLSSSQLSEAHKKSWSR